MHEGYLVDKKKTVDYYSNVIIVVHLSEGDICVLYQLGKNILLLVKEHVVV